ncbi:MAG: hypothetical protein JNM27_01175 [Leptospirales bacterium]|nr:hypothetical protein [Leptospirales bacterium]
MLDYTKPFTLAETLLNEFDGKDILADLRVYGVYTGDVFEPANNFGAFGFLPVAGTSTGDSLGLTPILGKPPQEWPVLKYSHNGGETCIVSSSLPLLAASSIVGHIRPGYIIEDREEILEAREDVLAFARVIGGETQALKMIQFLEGLKEDDENDFSSFFLYSQAEGLTWFVEFLNAYKKVYVEDEDAIETWKTFLKRYSFVTPAWELLFLAQSARGEDASEAAWKSATSERHLNDFVFSLCRANGMDFDFDATDSKNFELLAEDNARLQACRYLSESKTFAERPQTSAIKREAEEEDCAQAWLEAGNTLLKSKKFDEAYRCFLNSAGHYYYENGEFWKDSAIAALAAAKGMGEPVIVELIEPLTQEESEE